MENNFGIALLLTTIAGMATLVGAFCSFLIKKDNMKALSIGLAFSAGVMIFLSLNELLHESNDFLLQSSLHEYAKALSFLFFFVGAGVAALVDFFMPAHIDEELCVEVEKFEDCEENILHKHHHGSGKHEIKRAGIMTAVALSIHRIPEGLATFFIASTNLALGIPVAIAIAIHNFPEGIAVALPVYNATGKKRTAIFYSFLITLAGPFGAVLGFVFLKNFLSEAVVGVLFAIVAGIMVYISLDTLLPLARKYGENHHVMIGMISGMFFIAMSMLLL